MRLLDLTLPSPQENLALNEALLERAERSAGPREVLRLWEPAAPLVVVGASSRIADEVDEAACRQLGVPILRRPSGGAAIVGGPGCLMYAVVLSYHGREALRAIDHAHAHVLETVLAAIRPLVGAAVREGTSDLALDGRKFSGNSLRCKRDHLLYHGTLLYDFPLDLIARCLKRPPRQPEYRQDRDHESFTVNLPVPPEKLRQALIAAWQAHEPDPAWPAELTAELSASKYATREWNHRR